MRLIILILLTTLICSGALKEREKQDLSAVNILTNAGFENDKAGWSKTGSSTMTAETSNPLFGTKSMIWDASASGEYMQSADITIPKGLLGGNCEVGFTYQWDSGTAGSYQLQVLDGSDNVIVQTTDSSGSDPLAVTSSGNRGFKRLNFSCPTSGSLQFNLYSNDNSNHAAITIDGLWLGEARNVGQVSGVWTEYSESGGDFTVTGTNWTTTSAVLIPYRTQNGTWRIRGNIYGTISVAVSSIDLTISGISFSSQSRQAVAFATSQSSNALEGGWFEPATELLRIFANSTFTEPSLSFDIQLDSKPTWATRTADQQVYNLDTTAMAWSGYHDDNCLWTAAGLGTTPTGDASCTFTEVTNVNFGTVASGADGTGNQPSIVFTPKKIGIYKVCASTVLYHTFNGALNYIQMRDEDNNILDESWSRQDTDGTNARVMPQQLCGILTVDSIEQKTVSLSAQTNSGTLSIGDGAGWGTDTLNVNWHVYPITQSLPMPTIVQSYKSLDDKLNGIFSSYVTCSSSSSTSLERGGNWIDSVGNISAGACTINFASSTFSNEVACVLSNQGAGDPNTVLSTNSPTRLSLVIDCDTVGGTDCTGYTVGLICMARR